MFDLGLGSLLGGVVSGIGSIFGSSIGSNNNVKAVKEQNKGNLALAELAYQRDLEQWNRQNVYNSPIEQMKRIKDAGLNPNLMYGEGNVGNANSSPSFNPPNLASYHNFGDFGASQAGQALMAGLQGYVNVKKTEAETDSIRQNTQNLKADETFKELRNIYQGYVNSKTKDEADVWRNVLDAKLSEMDSNIIRNRAQSENLDSNRFYTDAQRERFNLLTPIVRQTAEVSLNQSLFDLYHLSPAKLRNIQASTAYQKILTKLTDIKSDLLFNDLEFSNERLPYKTEFAEFERDMKAYEVYFRQILKESGINVKGGNWFSPLLYNIYKDIAHPIGSAIDGLFE